MIFGVQWRSNILCASCTISFGTDKKATAKANNKKKPANKQRGTSVRGYDHIFLCMNFIVCLLSYILLMLFSCDDLQIKHHNIKNIQNVLANNNNSSSTNKKTFAISKLLIIDHNRTRTRTRTRTQILQLFALQHALN